VARKEQNLRPERLLGQGVNRRFKPAPILPRICHRQLTERGIAAQVVLYFETVFEGSWVPKRLAYRKKASLSTPSFGNPDHRCKFGPGAAFANSRLQPPRTNDADEEGDT
jgi:hypothetical protein